MALLIDPMFMIVSRVNDTARSLSANPYPLDQTSFRFTIWAAQSPTILATCIRHSMERSIETAKLVGAALTCGPGCRLLRKKGRASHHDGTEHFLMNK